MNCVIRRGMKVLRGVMITHVYVDILAEDSFDVF